MLKKISNYNLLGHFSRNGKNRMLSFHTGLYAGIIKTSVPRGVCSEVKTVSPYSCFTPVLPTPVGGRQ